MSAADMDEDGRTDLVWVNEDIEIHLFTGQANRTLKDRMLARTPSIAVQTYRPQLADFSGNGWKDIAFALGKSWRPDLHQPQRPRLWIPGVIPDDAGELLHAGLLP